MHSHRPHGPAPDGGVADPLVPSARVGREAHDQDVPHERDVAEDVDHRILRVEVARAPGRREVARPARRRAPHGRGRAVVRGIPDGCVRRDVRVDRRTVTCEEARVDRLSPRPRPPPVCVHAVMLRAASPPFGLRWSCPDCDVPPPGSDPRTCRFAWCPGVRPEDVSVCVVPSGSTEDVALCGVFGVRAEERVALWW